MSSTLCPSASRTLPFSPFFPHPKVTQASVKMGKASQIPHLRKTKTSAQLIVHGEPFLMLSAELHNSTLSSAKYMCDDAIWVNMKAMHINTLLGSVSWEMIEPEEGKFDFANLNEVILDARRHGMKLVLLWFGSFKNALSTYAPAWVKKDVKRFPRVHVSEAGAKTRTLELLSPFCEAAWEADARAFAALCRHLREFDAWNSTVVMLQVENETGLLGDSRDRSKIAEKRFREPVPSDLLQHRRSAGNLHHNFKTRFPNWQEKAEAHTRSKDLFGYEDEVHADEMFMANAFSRDVGKVAAAGKAEYPIPFYANVWLNFDDPSALDLADIPVVVGGGARAGVYPSGGPGVLIPWMCGSTTRRLWTSLHLTSISATTKAHVATIDTTTNPSSYRSSGETRRARGGFGWHTARILRWAVHPLVLTPCKQYKAP